jgi:hypothetical protein
MAVMRSILPRLTHQIIRGLDDREDPIHQDGGEITKTARIWPAESEPQNNELVS